MGSSIIEQWRRAAREAPDPSRLDRLWAEILEAVTNEDEKYYRGLVRAYVIMTGKTDIEVLSRIAQATRELIRS